jgi:transposase
MTQFNNERQLFRYTGLTPSEHSSGQKIRKGNITKQGNAHLRGILIEVAWRALKKDPDLAKHYEQLAARAGSKRAIVAVARKLIGRIRAAFRKGELYQIDSPDALATAS